MASLFSSFSTAIHHHQMITPGQKVLLTVSGGIDSMALSHLLAKYRDARNGEFELNAIYISIQQVGLQHDAIKQLKKYFEKLNVPLATISSRVPDDVAFRCYACAKERRKQFCTYAHEYGFDRVVLGHHKDDVLETALMNLIYHGHLETLAPVEKMFGGAITIIRPLINQSKKYILAYAKDNDIQAVPHDCDYGRDNQREFARKLIREISTNHKAFPKNFSNAINKWNEH